MRTARCRCARAIFGERPIVMYYMLLLLLFFYYYLGLFHFPRSRNYNVIYILFDIVYYSGENRKTIRTHVHLLYTTLRIITLQ